MAAKEVIHTKTFIPLMLLAPPCLAAELAFLLQAFRAKNMLVVVSILMFVLVMRQHLSQMATWSLHIPDISSLILAHLMLVLTIAVTIEENHQPNPQCALINNDNNKEGMSSSFCVLDRAEDEEKAVADDHGDFLVPRPLVPCRNEAVFVIADGADSKGTAKSDVP